MSQNESWAWSALFFLGAYHGINPGMGWLFAVALGMQERSGRAVARSLLPIALGHGLAIGLIVLVAVLVQAAFPVNVLKIPVAIVLFAFGLYRLLSKRHPTWGGMQVGFRDLTFWSFLMASAHGAGFMVLPVLLGISAAEHAHHPAWQGIFRLSGLARSWTSLGAVLIHTAGYLLVTGMIAWLVYEKLGLALLRKAWLNLDLIWAMALMATGCLTLFI